MPLKCSNNAQCFCFTKMLVKMPAKCTKAYNRSQQHTISVTCFIYQIVLQTDFQDGKPGQVLKILMVFFAIFSKVTSSLLRIFDNADFVRAIFGGSIAMWK